MVFTHKWWCFSSTCFHVCDCNLPHLRRHIFESSWQRGCLGSGFLSCSAQKSSACLSVWKRTRDDSSSCGLWDLLGNCRIAAGISTRKRAGTATVSINYHYISSPFLSFNSLLGFTLSSMLLGSKENKMHLHYIISFCVKLQTYTLGEPIDGYLYICSCMYTTITSNVIVRMEDHQ